MLGIVIGIASVIALVALGQGSTSSITSRIESMGSNLLMVSPKTDSPTARDLTLADADAIAKVAGVAAVAPASMGQYSVVGDANSVNVSVTGATDRRGSVPKVCSASRVPGSTDKGKISR